MSWAMRGEVRMKIANRVPDSRPDYLEAVRDFDEALKIDAGRAQTWIARSEAKTALGSITRDTGGNPLGEFEAAARDGDRAAELAPTMPDAWIAAGAPRVEAAACTVRLRKDPTEITKAAVDALTRGLDLDPASSRGRFYRGTAAYNLAAWKIAQGIRIGPECKAALADFEEAIRSFPGYRDRVAAAMSRCRKYLDEHPEEK
jgi:tetratricopeptide (TPR) repeat protein